MPTTTHVRAADLAPRWLLYDAAQFTLGDLATRIAMNLMGKDRPTYTPSELTGAFVVVINAEKVRITGMKRAHKRHEHYSGYPSGLRLTPWEEVLAKTPTEVVRQAVKRMLPKSTLGRDMRRRLKIYAGPEHPHAAQQPAAVAP